MIPEYEKDFAAWLFKRIKYDELEIPEGYQVGYNIPLKDLVGFEDE